MQAFLHIFPIFRRRLPCLLLKLSHKVYLTTIAAGVCNLVHRKGGGGQQVAGILCPGADEIGNYAGAVQLSVNVLERGTTQTSFLCQFIRGVVQVRFVVHLASDTVK